MFYMALKYGDCLDNPVTIKLCHFK